MCVSVSHKYTLTNVLGLNNGIAESGFMHRKMCLELYMMEIRC